LEVDQRQLDERIYDALKEKILQSELAPGTALTIRSVAQRLGVSVTPVRDALRRLQAEGLVQMQGRGETTVAQLEPGEIDDILDLRLALELHATRRGVTRMNGAALKRLEELLATAVRTFRSDAYHDYPAASRLDQEFHSVLVRAAGNERLTEIYETLGARVQIAHLLEQQTEGG
jgi:DNA-binding GntR family transcriptional regulator